MESPDHPPAASESKPCHTVSVRALVEFVLRRGDLVGARDFVGPRRALAGTRGHQRLQRSRPAGYQKEVPLGYEWETDTFRLRVQGRLDGLIEGEDGLLLEEIKTVQGGWDRQADPLHWAQLRCYGFMVAHARSLDQIDLRLTYLDLDTDEVTELRERVSRSVLVAFFEQTLAVYLEWVGERQDWCRRRDHSIRALAFPFPRYRPGQRALAVAVFRTLARGGRLFLEAPTGIGKTISVLFPAVKALGEGKLDRIYYLTARTVGRTVAEKAGAELRQAGLQLRVVTLTAKERVCVRQGQPCDARSCPLALGYYDRYRPAMRAALECEAITRPVLEALGQEYQVCPFELSLDVSLWADAVICDYNYAFDPQVYLRRHFLDEAGRYAFLVDEAHNLVDRARSMFSAELTTDELGEVRRSLRAALPRCARALERLAAAMRQLDSPRTVGGDLGELDQEACGEPDLFALGGRSAAEPARRERGVGIGREEGLPGRAGSWRELPAVLRPRLDDALEQAASWLALNEPGAFRERLLELYFRLHTFRRTAELYDDHYALLSEGNGSGSVCVRLLCLDPSRLLGEALTRGAATVLFSATLTPMDYYCTLLGGCPEDPVLQLPSPFPAHNLAVLVHDRVRTTWRARAATLDEVVEAIGAVTQPRTGNYLVYLPSYAYLGTVQERFCSRFPEVAVRVQRPGMTEAEREAFLGAFAAEGRTSLVGFAVLGGVFGEGIDLVGERLIGVVCVGVGLPQLGPERDLISQYFQDRTGAGFDYAYTFPGVNRVLQAVGRVIRSETDRGVVLLIDTRFAEARYRALLPKAWQPWRVRSAGAIRAAVDRFWA